jgi:DNA-binding transcriptional regulator YiaG
MKSMLPKQKSYIPRFALLLNTLWSFNDTDYPYQKVQKDSILRAEKLSEYFVNMAKLVKQDAREKTDLKNVSKDKNNTFDKFKAMYEADSELNKSVVAEMLDVSRRTIYDWVKKLDK